MNGAEADGYMDRCLRVDYAKSTTTGSWTPKTQSFDTNAQARSQRRGSIKSGISINVFKFFVQQSVRILIYYYISRATKWFYINYKL